MADEPITIPGAQSALPWPERRFRPLATHALIALNAAVFLLMTFVDFSGHPRLPDFLLRTFTGFSADPDLLVRFGASFGPYIRRGEYWRLVTPMFLHVGLIHFLLNNYALLVLGRLLERVYNYGRFGLLYVACGVGSAFLSVSMSNNVSAGASGAIFGVAGAILVLGYVRRVVFWMGLGRVLSREMLALNVLVILVLGFAARRVVPLDNWGHVGGLLSGIVLALLIPPTAPATFPEETSEEGFQIVALLPLAVVVLAMAAEVQAYRTSREVDRLLEEGEHFRTTQKYDRAIERFREASRRAPRDEHPHEALGSVYMDLNRVVDAVREYNEALHWNPASDEAQLGLAQAYEQSGNLAKAREVLKAIEDSLPPGADSQAALAALCAQHKLYPDAIRHYVQALKLKPEMAVAHNNLAWLFATCDDSHYRNPQAALEHARRAVELTEWKEAGFIDTLAEALYANRKFGEAVKVQTRALELEPGNSELEEHMARYRKAAGV